MRKKPRKPFEIHHKSFVSVMGEVFRVFDYGKFKKEAENGIRRPSRSKGYPRRSHKGEWFAVSDRGCYVLDRKNNALMSKKRLERLLNNGGYTVSGPGYWGGYLLPVKTRHGILKSTLGMAQ